MSEATQRNTEEAMAYAKSHRTTAQIGYNPDNRCLQLTREDRNILAKWPTAFMAQIHTPEEHRIFRVQDMRRGHVLFVDDPLDSNEAGHIVPIFGRIKGAELDDPSGLVTLSNSVKSGQRVFVPATFYQQHWGDDIQFAADFLNGEPFYDMKPKAPRPPKQKKPKLTQLKVTLENLEEGLDEMIASRNRWRGQDRPKLAKQLTIGIKLQRQSIQQLKKTIDDFGRK